MSSGYLKNKIEFLEKSMSELKKNNNNTIDNQEIENLKTDLTNKVTSVENKLTEIVNVTKTNNDNIIKNLQVQDAKTNDCVTKINKIDLTRIDKLEKDVKSLQDIYTSKIGNLEQNFKKMNDTINLLTKKLNSMSSANV
jgi:hypothetical protein